MFNVLSAVLAALALASAPPLGSGAERVTCKAPHFIGSGKPDWRRESDHAGRLGLSGSRRGGGPNLHEEPFEDDGLLRLKTPTLVEGRRPVVLSVPPAERHRVGILTLHSPKHGLAKVVFVPCGDRPRTIWAGGLVLRDRRPLRLTVRAAGGPPQTIRVGG
jgi:hypothetical protein